MLSMSSRGGGGVLGLRMLPKGLLPTRTPTLPLAWRSPASPVSPFRSSPSSTIDPLRLPTMAVARQFRQLQWQQRRSYLFLPTSWKELQLWLRPPPIAPTELSVVLPSIHPHDKPKKCVTFKKKGRVDALARRASSSLALRLWRGASAPFRYGPVRGVQSSNISAMLQQQPSSNPVPRPTVHLRAKTAMRRLLRLVVCPVLQQQRWPRRTKGKRRRQPLTATTAASQQRRVPVVLPDHVDASWFDALGRPLTSRDETGRFVNPWISQSANGVKGLGTLLQWRWQRLQRELREWQQQWKDFSAGEDASTPSSTTIVPPHTNDDKVVAPPLAAPSHDSTLRLTWIGHATCLLQQGGPSGVTLLTDPIFSHRASPFPDTWIGIGRSRPPAWNLNDLPASLDICLISHDHYDHLDKESVRALQERVRLWIVPLGAKRWMIRKGHVPAARVVELEWWESVQLVWDDQCRRWTVARRHSLREHPYDAHPATHGRSTSRTKDGAQSGSQSAARRSLWITGLPVQHWGSRTFWDRNMRLWLSYAVLFESATGDDAPCFYFAGDTAWPRAFPLLFAQIRAYLPRPIDLAAIPIGAYAPALVNQDAHVNPPEAVQVHASLGARQSVAIHHGCFALAEEPLGEPAAWLPRAVAQAGLAWASFVAVPPGASLDVSGDASVDTSIDRPTTATPATVRSAMHTILPSQGMGAIISMGRLRRRGRAVPPRYI